MRSIDGVNSVRVRTAIPVVNVSEQNENIDVKFVHMVSEPTILSTRDKNARLVFYSSIQPATAKISSGRIKRTRTIKSSVTISENLDERIAKLLQEETISQDSSLNNYDSNSDVGTLPLFSYSPESHQVTGLRKARNSSVKQAKQLSLWAGEYVAKGTSEVIYKTDYLRGTMTKFVKTIDRKFNNS
jgi:hypothetical protein